MSQNTLFNLAPHDPEKGYAEFGNWISCPSVIQADDGTWRMFASRWPKSLPMHPGWLTNSEAVVAEADRPEGPYRFKATVLPPRGAQWWDGRMTHNPRVIKTPEGYALFYTGVSHPLSEVTPGERLSLDDPRVTCARAAKRVVVALADCADGPWRRLDAPLLSVKPDTFYSFLS